MTRIVLADDHPFLRAGVEAVLSGNGMEIAASVDNGEAALEAVSREAPDVVILDVRMPGMDGVEVLKALRARGDQRPVILLTAELEDAALLGAIRAQVSGIVFKDDVGARLQEAVRTVLSGQRQIDPALISRATALLAEEQSGSPLDLLSRREREIAEGVAQGKRNRDIAEAVGMTEGSIKVYLHRIYEKLGVENRTALAVMMLEARKTG